LADFDPETYRRELEAISNFLQRHQRMDGAWTYLHSGESGGGDMSMVQYAVLAYWALEQSGIPVPSQAMLRAARWLIAAQDADGGYAYQTTLDANLNIVSRSGAATQSMTAAGMASIYAFRDLFGMDNNQPQSQLSFEVPPVFVRLPRPEAEQSNQINVNQAMRADFRRAQMRGDQWLRTRFSPISRDTSWLFYYLYAIERYWSFREVAENNIEASPAWYNTAANFLIADQNADGGWTGGGCGDSVDTAYAILVLLRSTRQSIAQGSISRLSGGRMLGGRGLPESTDDIRVLDGQVISMHELADMDQLARLLDELIDLDEEALAAGSLGGRATGHRAAATHANQFSQLGQLVSASDAGTRLAAVDMIGRSSEVRHVPTLLYALTDPDEQVVAAAVHALNRLSRSLEPGPTPGGMQAQLQEIPQLIEKWRTWYRGLDASSFMDF